VANKFICLRCGAERPMVYGEGDKDRMELCIDCIMASIGTFYEDTAPSEATALGEGYGQKAQETTSRTS
jgi:hypothetical protein